MDRLEELKRLLFRDEQRVLHDIDDRLRTPDRRAADLAEVLPESIEASHRQGRFASAIRKPLAEVMTSAIREEPQAYADALFPVIGPAIRRAVAEAFKSLSQQLNQAIEHSITPQGLRWRFQAWRSGVPFSEYLMQRTLLYRVEQVYLIDADSGLLISHVADKSIEYKDEDAVSAMFSALQDFIKDSFLSEDRKGLETAEMGDLTIWAVHGPESILACAIRGMPPRSLRADMREILERIEGRFRETLVGFTGIRDDTAGVERELRKCLRSSQKKAERTGRVTPTAIIGVIAGLLLLAWLGYTLIAALQARRLGAEFESTPGIVVTDIGKRNGKLVVNGFRDPLAENVATIIARANLKPDRVRAALTPFVSLDPDIVLLRAGRVLDPPAGISIESSDTGLTVSGTASADWLGVARQRALLVAGLENTSFDVKTEQAIDDGHAQFDALLRKLDGTTIRFARSDELESGQVGPTRQIGADLARLQDHAEKLGIELSLVITGFSDDSGAAEANARVEVKRAEKFARLLSQAAGRRLEIARVAAGPASPARERKAVLTIRRLEAPQGR